MSFARLGTRGRVALLTILGFLSWVVPLVAQTASGTIAGNVHDSSGAAVPNAAVTARELRTGLTRSTVSNAEGDYVLSDLPVGQYTIEASSAGFQTLRQTDIRLDVGKVLKVDAALTIGEVKQQVEVSGTPPQLETRDSSISGLVDEQRMIGLPLNGRNALQLTTLLPGVQPAANTVFQTSNTLPQQQFVSLSGGRGNTVVYLLDGGTNQDNYTNVANIYPNPDALQEFSVITNTYPAEYGTRLGGVVNAVTRSGTNSYHGAIFEYVRNDFFNADNYFSPGVGDGLKRNQYGFAAGGPIKKDKLFIFGSWQGTHLRQQPVGLQAVVPTAAQLQGNFAGLTNSKGEPIQLVNPANDQPYLNNQINPATFDPVAVKLLNYIPAATNSTGLVNVYQINDNNDDQYIVKGDYLPTSSDRISVRWIHDAYTVLDAVDPADLLGAQRLPDFHTQNGTVSWTHVISPTLLLNSSFTFNRIQSGLSYGYPTTLNELGSSVLNLGVNSDIVMSVGGFFSIPTVAGGLLARNDFQEQSSLTWVHGKHEWKFGVDILRMQLNQPGAAFNSDGNFSFTAAFSGSNLVDYLLGYGTSFTQATPQAEALRGLIPASYVQDTYKVTSKLTLNYGLRWEPFLPWVDVRNNEVATFIPGEQSQVAPGLPPGLVVYGDPGVPRAGYNGSLGKFDPRAGFAYQLTSNTVIRGGAGVYRDYPSGIANNRITLGAPFAVQINVQNPTSIVDPFTAAQPNPYPTTIPPAKDYVFPRPVLGVVYAHDFTNAHAFQQNLTIEHQLSTRWLVRLSYLGSEGHNLLANEEINPAAYVPGETTKSNINANRPLYPIGFTSITQFESNGISNYNAGAVTLEKQMNHGFSLLASYTFSKSTDMSSAVGTGGVYGIYTDPANGYYDHGLSDFNRTHRFVASFIYDSPLFSDNRALHYIVGNWELNGIVTVESGLPVNITDGVNQSLNGVSGTPPDRPNVVSDPNNGPKTVAEWFNTGAFELNAYGTYGTEGRNAVEGPGYFDVDYSMTKTFPIHESLNLKIRAEAFNLFNHTNFDNPVSVLNSPLFGRLTTAEPPRVLQFALRFNF
jgi:hypothetical protein